MSLQSCPTLCDPIDGSPPGSPSLGFSRQEHWSGLPFPSPMHESEKWKWNRSVVSEDTLRDPMDCSLPGSSAHGIFQARVLEWGAIAFSRYFCPTLAQDFQEPLSRLKYSILLYLVSLDSFVKKKKEFFSYVFPYQLYTCSCATINMSSIETNACVLEVD